MFNRLSNNLQNNELNVTPPEACHPTGAGATRVTLNLPAAAVDKLSQLAEAGGGDSDLLRELGILSLRVEGGQLISVTVAGDSEVEDKAAVSRPASLKSSPRELADKCGPGLGSSTIKQEAAEPVQRPHGHSSLTGLPLGSLLSQSPSKDNLAALLKNHSSLSFLSPAEQSVLQSYMSTMSTSGGSGSSEALLSSLMSASKSGSSSLHLSKDNGEPVNKKPRKLDSDSMSKHSISPKSKLDTSGGGGVSGAINSKFPYTKTGGATSGFSLLPVNNCSGSGSSAASLRGGSSSEAASIKSTSPSALRIASLPGVSLTAVPSSGSQPRNNTQAAGPGLMPPPPPTSAVTLSPVPRSSSSVSSVSVSSVSSSSSSSSSTETGDKSVSSVPSSKLSLVQSDNNISLSQSLDTRPLLINPVTGQFEAGLSDMASESENDNSKNDQSSDSDIMEEDGDNEESLLRHQRTKSGSQSPANSTSEPSLKFKLKVSSTPVNNSSKNLLAPKNDVMLKTGSNSKPLDAAEPKVPKLKIRLGKDKNAVKLNHEVENHDSNDLDDNFSLVDKSLSSTSPQTNDLKTKIKIKPLTGSPGSNSDDSSVHSSITSPYFPTLANNIVNHTNIEDRKKKKDKVKDRLAVWTESLAKHGQRAEDGVKEEKVKETKSWPEVLEARLYGGPGHANNSNSSSPTGSDHGGSLSFSKYDSVLENQTEKGEDQRSVKSEGEENNGNGSLAGEAGPGRGDNAGTLNCLGPGGRDLPGPGHTHSPPHPASPATQQPAPPSHAHSLNTVLDILEGRPALSELGPMSPDCAVRPSPGGAREQQGEDSGIESMDSRSEKSPNQGESPFHGSTESELGRTPTYSSSMGPSSGKMSPPVSEISSCDTGPGSTEVSPHSATFTQPVQSSSAAGHQAADGKNSFLDESHKDQVTITEKDEDTGNDLNEAKSNGDEIASSELKTENGEPFENHKSEVETKSEEVLLRSCDGADDPKLPVVAEAADKPEITNCMHDYASSSAATNHADQPPPPPARTQPAAAASAVKVAVSSAGPGPVVTTVNIAGSTVAVRPGGLNNIPPGARMVPVKLVTVPGATGNVRMLRVSPVKTVAPGALPPRTVVIKSSVLKAVSSQDQAAAEAAATPSLVRFPVPGAAAAATCDTATVSTAAGAAPQQPSQSLSSIVTTAITSSPSPASSTLLKKSHQVSLTPVETNSCSLDTNTKAAPVTFQKRASVEAEPPLSAPTATSTSAASPLSVDVSASNRLTDSEQMPSPAQKAAQRPASKCNGEDSGGLDTQQPPSSPRAKSKKSSGDLLKHDSCEGESLLRPLLAKEEPSVEVSASPASPSLPSLDSPSVLTLPLANPRKRTRRDTGSSVNSDRSDLSTKSTDLQQQTPASKRAKATSPAPVGRRTSQSTERTGNKSDESQSKTNINTENEDKSLDGDKNRSSKTKSDIGNGLPEAENTTKKSKSLERSKGRTLVKNANNTNIKSESKTKTSPKKTENVVVKKVGRPKTQDAASDHPTSNSVPREADKLVPSKVDISGRRVSTRSKKPDESSAVVTKRR